MPTGHARSQKVLVRQWEIMAEYGCGDHLDEGAIIHGKVAYASTGPLRVAIWQCGPFAIGVGRTGRRRLAINLGYMPKREA